MVMASRIAPATAPRARGGDPWLLVPLCGGESSVIDANLDRAPLDRPRRRPAATHVI
ncbi:hypothetical protein OG559_09270 [Micromonospora sp. NBC_01405]|uniref:hypothetical protein n=1 Tax=Micromonospora sp. NBC_01405 TaxID=2903589 RepID=UPI0032479E57